jgi:hypothetical protein
MTSMRCCIYPYQPLHLKQSNVLKLMTRLDVGHIMIRINFYVENVTCVICDGVNEDMKDLFSQCDFNQNLWWKLNHE